MDLVSFMDSCPNEVSFLKKEKKKVSCLLIENTDLTIFYEAYQKLCNKIPYKFRKFFIYLNFDEFLRFLNKLKSKSL